MGRIAIIVVLALICGVGVASAQQAPGGEEGRAHLGEVQEAVTNHPRLEEAIDDVLSDDELQRSRIGIHVEDLSTGEVLYSRDADRQLNPASNVKLLTAAAVLDELGPNHTFSTELSTRRKSDGRLDHLYVRGEGEAFLLFKDVLQWAVDLRRQGVEVIEGDVVIDDSAFAEAYLPPGFDLRESGAAWRSPIGAVSINFNAVTATVEPADRPGQSPKVRVDPPSDHVRVVNRARTTAGSLARIEVEASADEQGTTLTISGTIGTNADGIARRKRIDDPPAFAGAVVAEAMSLVGVEFDGQVRRGEVPEQRDKLVVHHSAPVMRSVSAMNKWSNNFIAEQLLRVLGTLDDEPSTWEASRWRARTILSQYGLPKESYALLNGSGLYDGNELSARQLVRLLKEMKSHRYGPEFVSSLAIAGVDGTLRQRLGDDPMRGNLRAKTGTLRDVTALSGYVTTASGRPVAFSILFNDTPRRAWNYRAEQDEIARAIAEFDD